MLEMKVLASVLLLIFLNIAAFDGLYLHLYKYKLYSQEESKKEHLIHTINTFLFPWSIYFLFLNDFKGLYLWFGVALTFISMTLEFFDVFEENQSRSQIGGLTSFEYALHFAMGCLRASYTTLILVIRPASDWSLTAESFESSELDYKLYFVYPFLCVSIFIFALHFLLIFQEKYKGESACKI